MELGMENLTAEGAVATEAISVKPAPPKVYTADERSDLVVSALVKLDAGSKLTEIAEEAGVTMGTLRRWLMSEAPDRYRSAQTNGLIQRVIEADDKLEGATSYLEITKADKMAKYARWDAERRAPRLFAQRTELTGAGGEPLIPADLGEVARRLAFVMAQGANSARSEGLAVIDVQAEKAGEI